MKVSAYHLPLPASIPLSVAGPHKLVTATSFLGESHGSALLPNTQRSLDPTSTILTIQGTSREDEQNGSGFLLTRLCD